MTILLWSCVREDVAQPKDQGYDYFPTTVGSWVEYQVDSIWRDDAFQVHDSISYRLKQVIAGQYIDPGGRQALRIERFVWHADDWVIRDVWSGVRTKFGAEVVEENQRKLNISFPVREGRNWDVNILNSMKELHVAASEVDQAHSIGETVYDRTFLIENSVPANLVVRRDYMERYASGIGMIEHYWHSDSIQFSQHKSVIYCMTARAYGIN